MVKKGIVSSVNSQEKKARVFLPEENLISPELPYDFEVLPNDTVAVAFYDEIYTDGVILQNLSRDPTPIAITEIDGGSFV